MVLLPKLSDVNSGAGAGLAGAWQMVSGGISGALIVALGGTETFQLAVGALMIITLASILSMRFVYQRR